MIKVNSRKCHTCNKEGNFKGECSKENNFKGDDNEGTNIVIVEVLVTIKE